MGFEETLKACDTKQLNKYLTDDDSLDILVTSQEEYQNLVDEKETLQKRNKQLAENNLSKKNALDDAKRQLITAIAELDKAKNEYLELLSNQNALTVGNNQDMSLVGIQQALEFSAVKAEEDTEKLAEDFFLTDANKQYTEDELNQFQKIFLDSRIQAHLKKIKAEKLKELI